MMETTERTVEDRQTGKHTTPVLSSGFFLRKGHSSCSRLPVLCSGGFSVFEDLLISGLVRLGDPDQTM
jgi:hypothetical protein